MFLSGLLESDANVRVTTLSPDEIEDMDTRGKNAVSKFPIGGHGDIHYPVVIVNDVIVGIAKIWKSTIGMYPFHSISMIEVAPKFRDNGYAAMLTDEMFKQAAWHGWTLGVHDYTEQGWKKMKPLFIEKAKQYGVKFIDTDSKNYTQRGEDWGEPVRKNRFT